MRTLIALRTVCLVGALALALAPAAAGKPAGDEYLPKVPESNGSGAVSSGVQETFVPEEPEKKPKKKPKKQKRVASTNLGPTPSLTSSDDSGGGVLDTLLDPVVLLLIAGVTITAIGMTMKRRQALAGESGVEGGTRELGTAPPTPDGEIIGREPPA
jgi:hypothetical protein